MEGRCKTCKWWKSMGIIDDDAYVGTCQRYPPSIPVGISVGVDATFPSVHDDQWCGEYQPNEDSQE